MEKFQTLKEGFMLNIDIKRSRIQGGPDIQVFSLNVDTNRSQTWKVL